MKYTPLALLLLACNGPTALPATTDVPATDVPAADLPPPPDVPPPAADVPLPLDRVAPTDIARGDAPPEVSLDDAPTIAADVVIDPGMCGAGVRTCFCNCGSNAVCQQGCINRDEDCGFCVYTAATRCCPAPSDALDRCIDASMCTDDPCIRTRCATEVAAFEGCFAATQMTDPACQREMRGCLGSDYPNVRCVMQR
jgi:hypothetical protein